VKKKLIIIGTGLFAEVAKCYFDDFSEYTVTAFACHQKYKSSDTMLGVPIESIEQLQDKFSPEEYYIFVAVGYKNMNKLREAIYKEIKSKGFNFVSFIHPDIKIWNSTTIGENVFIFEDNTIQPYTKIGNNTILWSGNHIGHHSQIGENCFISSQVVISGSCIIGNNVFIGVNSTLRDNLIIGNETLIGAGAIIMRNTKEKEVYIPSATKVFPKPSDRVRF